MPRKPTKPKKPATKASAAGKLGRKPEVLEPFDGTFEQAIDGALSKTKPAGGWPK
ncbi:MAG TPA: hypothetical protein VK797_13965 [Tepidisphaeraceae bacterium]|jgi:hypothetical protein|nr:hypothetical protein [Tepidisphaeraceae bacterium]